MSEISASEAKAHFFRLRRDVERGEALIVTRHGRLIARILPEAHRRQQPTDKAIAGITAFRRKRGVITKREIL